MNETDDTGTDAATITIDFKHYERMETAFEQRQAAILPHNKAALFATLAAAGIDTVIVEFDGSGDSGQIESIEGFAANSDTIELPDTQMEVPQASFGRSEITTAMLSPREVIETMAYDFLTSTHGGWENDDGAYGEFTFTVADRSIGLSYNERYTESTNHEHEF